MSKNKLQFLWVNLQQFIVFETFEESNVINPIICAGHRGNKIFLVDSMKRDLLPKVATLLREHADIKYRDYHVIWVASFHIDSWDERLRAFQSVDGFLTNTRESLHRFADEG